MSLICVLFTLNIVMNQEKPYTDILSELVTMDKDVAEVMQKSYKIEEEGLKNTVKHFDRIHDKLFTFNNVLIAGFFALAKIAETINITFFLIPIANMIWLIWIEYRMLSKSRFESKITEKSVLEREVWGKSIDRINRYSLWSILSTALVTVIFLILLLFSE